MLYHITGSCYIIFLFCVPAFIRSGSILLVYFCIKGRINFHKISHEFNRV